jgi:chromosomal replication initiator protein
VDPEKVWSAGSAALREQVSPATWSAWFEGVSVSSEASNGHLVLSVPSTLVKERIEDKFLDLVREVVTEATPEADRSQRGPGLLDVDIVVRPGGPGDASETGEHLAAGGTAEVLEHRASGAATTDQPAKGRDLAIDPRFTFEAFVIGTSNRFAHAAAQSVAETPGKSYNPLFIHGSAGLGKTHLLHAIGNFVKEFFPNRVVRYVTTETFLNEYVDMIRSNTGPAFRRRYRECDVLLLDDVQFMEGKEGLQEEFFHTFNHLSSSQKQIVLTSDRSPKAIATLEQRLQSRFLSGLTTDIQPPNLETRLAILRKKADADGLVINHDVLELIASNITENIRELEGALIRVSAFASLDGVEVTTDLAARVLDDMMACPTSRTITPEQILRATAETFGFSIDELIGPNRRRPLVQARQIGMYVFRELTDYSYPAIGREFGGRDHTTAIHAVTKISQLMKARRQVFDQVTSLITRVRSGE